MAKATRDKPPLPNVVVPHPPPWEVLALITRHLDPKTLAIASCVSKSWQAAASSDHLWQPVTTAHFPSLATALKAVHPSLPYRRLYGLAHSAAPSRRLKPLPKPSISLHDLVFSIDLRRTHQDETPALVSLAGPADQIAMVDSAGAFRFDVTPTGALHVEAETEVRVTWHVVLSSGWRAAFTLMDGVVRVRQAAAVGLFSEELPPPGCCPVSDGKSAVAADLKMEFGDHRRGDHNRKVLTLEKVSLGLLSTLNWRYISLEDGLRYLQHFLLDTRFS